MIYNKYYLRFLETFPNDLGFIGNRRDPLNVYLQVAGSFMNELDYTKNREVGNLFIGSCDPTIPWQIYYVDLSESSYSFDTTLGGVIVDNNRDFLSMDITGFEDVGEISPSGVNNIVGVSYGFDWDEPKLYITTEDSEFVKVYNPTTLELEREIDYSYQYQSFEASGSDEYLNLIVESAGDEPLPSGVSPDQLVKVAYLARNPFDDIKIIDILNLKNPNDPNSDGIVVNPMDYAIQENGRIVFAFGRSDVVEAEEINIDGNIIYNYPDNYQPDEGFNSVYIVEYKYKNNSFPGYLTSRAKLHNLNLAGNPEASFKE